MGLFSLTKKFTDAFFNGMSTNLTNKAMTNARKQRLKADAIRKEEQRIRNEKELEKILNGDY